VTVHVRSEHARGSAVARRLRQRACRYLAALGREDAEVSILVVGDAAVRRLNRTWRGKDRPTDVLSFPLTEPNRGPPAAEPAGPKSSSRATISAGRRGGEPTFPLLEDRRSGRHLPHPLLGDIVISLDTATRVARRDGRAVGAELDRYLAHGLLHLVGYDHQRAEDASLMAAKEDALVGEGMLTGAQPGRRRSAASPPSRRRRAEGEHEEWREASLAGSRSTSR